MAPNRHKRGGKGRNTKFRDQHGQNAGGGNGVANLECTVPSLQTGCSTLVLNSDMPITITMDVKRGKSTVVKVTDNATGAMMGPAVVLATSALTVDNSSYTRTVTASAEQIAPSKPEMKHSDNADNGKIAPKKQNDGGKQTAATGSKPTATDGAASAKSKGVGKVAAATQPSKTKTATAGSTNVRPEGVLAPPWGPIHALEKALGATTTHAERVDALAAVSKTLNTPAMLALQAWVDRSLLFNGNGTSNLCMFTSMLVQVTGTSSMDPTLVSAATALRDASKKVMRVVRYLPVDDVKLLGQDKFSVDTIETDCDDKLGNTTLQLGASIALAAVGIYLAIHTRSVNSGMTIGDLAKGICGDSELDSFVAGPRALLADSTMTSFLNVDAPGVHYYACIPKASIPVGEKWLPKGVTGVPELTAKLTQLVAASDEDIKVLLNAELEASRSYARMVAAVGANGRELSSPQYPTQFALLPTELGNLIKERTAASAVARTTATAQGLSRMMEHALRAQQRNSADITATAAKRTEYATRAVAQHKEVQAAVAKAQKAKDTQAKAAATAELEKLAAVLATTQSVFADMGDKMKRLKAAVAPSCAIPATAEAMRALTADIERKRAEAKATATAKQARAKERAHQRKAKAMAADATVMAELQAAMDLAKAEQAELNKRAKAAPKPASTGAGKGKGKGKGAATGTEMDVDDTVSEGSDEDGDMRTVSTDDEEVVDEGTARVDMPPPPPPPRHGHGTRMATGGNRSGQIGTTKPTTGRVLPTLTTLNTAAGTPWDTPGRKRNRTEVEAEGTQGGDGAPPAVVDTAATTAETTNGAM